MPEGTAMPEGTGDTNGSFGGSAGTQSGSAELPQDPAAAEPEKTAQPTEKAAEGETAAEKPAESTRPERPSGMPDGMNFPGMDGMRTSQSGLWIETAVCAAVLLAALLIIRKAGSHNQ